MKVVKKVKARKENVGQLQESGVTMRERIKKLRCRMLDRLVMHWLGRQRETRLGRDNKKESHCSHIIRLMGNGHRSRGAEEHNPGYMR